MGCGASQVLAVYARPEVREKRELYEALNFNELDVGRLHSVYRKIDNDGSNSIELAELLAFLDLDRTRFTKRIFTMFDEDNSGLLDFNEFVLSLWNYCTLSKASLELFAFDLYDEDNSGSITQNEVLNMLKDLYGKEYKKNPQAKLIATELEALERLDGDVDVADFREYSRTHPALLFLAFQVQETIQTRVLGPVFWKFYSDKRIEISKGRLYVPVYEFVEIFVNQELKKSLVTGQIGMGQQIHKRDVGFVPQKKLDGVLSSKAKLILENTGSISDRLKHKGVQGSKVAPGGEQDEVDDDRVNTLRKLYERDATVGTADRRASMAVASAHSVGGGGRRGSVMPGDLGQGAGTKGIHKKTKRRSFDNLAHEKSKALYSDNGLNTYKDSHIHSVQEALLESKKLQEQGASGFDPIRHNKIVEEFQSFSVANATKAPPQVNAGRRASVAHALSDKSKSKRRSFDNGYYNRKGNPATVHE